jgi:hypothetical protein
MPFIQHFPFFPNTVFNFDKADSLRSLYHFSSVFGNYCADFSEIFQKITAKDIQNIPHIPQA